MLCQWNFKGSLLFAVLRIWLKSGTHYRKGHAQKRIDMTYKTKSKQKIMHIVFLSNQISLELHKRKPQTAMRTLEYVHSCGPMSVCAVALLLNKVILLLCKSVWTFVSISRIRGQEPGNIWSRSRSLVTNGPSMAIDNVCILSDFPSTTSFAAEA